MSESDVSFAGDFQVANQDRRIDPLNKILDALVLLRNSQRTKGVDGQAFYAYVQDYRDRAMAKASWDAKD
jgi:hypothetical protein